MKNSIVILIILIGILRFTSAATDLRTFATRYNTVVVEGHLKVTVNVHSPEQVEITAPTSTLISAIQTVVTGSTLTIRPLGLTPDQIGQITISANVYNELNIVTIVANSGSSVNVLQNVGSSFELTLIINQGSAITAVVDARLVKAVINGSGVIAITGQAGTCNVNINGAGRFVGGQLETGTTDIRIFGSGDLIVAAHLVLSGHIEGAAIVSYRYDPQITVTTNGFSNFVRI